MWYSYENDTNSNMSFKTYVMELYMFGVRKKLLAVPPKVFVALFLTSA
jgi:hypothetical protein